MQKTYNYRIYPSKAQQRQLEQTLGLCCELYNAALQERRDAWSISRTHISYHTQAVQLPEIKELRPEFGAVHSQVLQETLNRLDKAFANFFRRVKEKNGKAGFPRFRSRARYDSFTYPQSGFVLKADKLQLSKIGKVKIKKHRPFEGNIKTCTIIRAATGKWFVCFSVEAEKSPLPDSQLSIGVDVGLKEFAVLSNGEAIPNPKFLRKEEKELAKAQRKLSAAKKGRPERKKRRKVVARVHERIRNKRQDFAHQESRKLVNRFGILIFEKLNIRGMLRNHHL